MVKRKQKNEAQLSLFENNELPVEPAKPTTVLDFVRARFEHGPDMTQEEYRHWIKVLIHNSLKSID